MERGARGGEKLSTLWRSVALTRRAHVEGSFIIEGAKLVSEITLETAVHGVAALVDEILSSRRIS